MYAISASLLNAHSGFSCFFWSHIYHLVVCFDSLEPVVHLMHSALMVMFHMLAMNRNAFVLGKEEKHTAINPSSMRFGILVE